MAINFSSSAISSLAQNRPRFEPHRQYNFKLFIEDLPLSNGEELQLHIDTGMNPNPSFDEIELGYGNDYIYVTGKARVEPLSFTFKDMIAPSTAAILWAWYQEHYDPETGVMYYASNYKKSATLFKADPLGNPLKHWKIQGLWIQSANFGNLDFNASDIVRIEVNFRFDRAIGKGSIDQLNPAGAFSGSSASSGTLA